MAFTYNIDSRVTNGEFAITVVTYTFDNSQTVSVEIYHFQPDNEAEVTLGIQNRGVTEALKLAGV